MFSHSRPLRSPDSGAFDSGGGAPKIEFTRDAYQALVQVVRNPPKDMPADLAIRVCAVNFYNNATVALRGGTLAPETALALMDLKNPATGENVFHETKLLPTLVEVASVVILQRIQAGKAVEYSALSELREYAASPHSLGLSGSITAYRALLAAATRCYRRSSGADGGAPLAIDPISEIASLGAALQRTALLNSKEVCEFVKESSTIPVTGPLREGVDRMMSLLSQPIKAKEWGPVQAEALLAAALCCVRNNGSSGGASGAIINRHAVYMRALRGLEESEDPQFLGVAVILVRQLLSDELKDMRESVDTLMTSSFGRFDYPGGHQERLERLAPKIHRMFPEESGAADVLSLSLAVSARLANRVSWGILVFDIIGMSSKILPAGIFRSLKGALHQGFRRLSSLS